MEFDRKDIQLANLSKVFTPSAPITASDFFVRRLGEIEEITESVAEPGQHAVLYGERGVEKTSLANFIDSVLSNAYNLV
jgi:replication-associated recombination protein RarA